MQKIILSWIICLIIDVMVFFMIATWSVYYAIVGDSVLSILEQFILILSFVFILVVSIIGVFVSPFIIKYGIKAKCKYKYNILYYIIAIILAFIPYLIFLPVIL